MDVTLEGLFQEIQLVLESRLYINSPKNTLLQSTVLKQKRRFGQPFHNIE